jgi:aspartyl-tRNA(Asn)/glutamyl-tRNA(Gln) amidotransferase subunit B
MRTPEEARVYLEEIRLLLRELEVSDCEMQEGSLRCDANINLHIPQPDASIAATPIVEVKNLNSFRAVERALRFEATRQFEEFQRTGQRLGDVPKATAGWDENRGATVIQRRKEEASDYRYFPDPDLLPVLVEEAWVGRVRSELGELPAALRERLQSQYGLSPYDAGVITQQGRAFTSYFETVARVGGDAKDASNWLTNAVLAVLKERKLSIQQFPIPAANLGELIRRTRDMGLNKQRTRDVFGRMLETQKNAEEAIRALGFQVVADTDQLRALVRQALAANAKAVEDYRKGKVKAIDAVKGAIMRQTKGMAKIEVVQQLLLEELQQEQK